MLDQFIRNLAEILETVARSTGGTIFRNDQFVAMDIHRPGDFINSALYFEPLSDATQAQPVEEFYDGNGTGEVMLWSATTTADLSARGWLPAESPPFMVNVPLRPPEPIAGVRTTEVSNSDQLAACERLWVEDFPFKSCVPCERGSILGESFLEGGKIPMWLACVEGEPVATSLAFTSGGLTNVEMVVVKREERRKGLGTYMTRLAASSAPSLPSALLASHTGRPVYESLGFHAITRVTIWHRER